MTHSLPEDFAHFLAYQNYSRLPAEEIERLRVAYEHGASRGTKVSDYAESRRTRGE